MRAREILEIQDLNVDGMHAGQYGLSSKGRKQGHQMYLGSYKGFKVWSRDLRYQGDTNHEWDIEVITKEIPHPFVGKGRPEDDEELRRRFDGPREYVVLKLDLKPYIMQGNKGQEVSGSNVKFVQKVPEGVGSDIDMVDFYIWIMNKLNTAMISDSKQSKGGASIWKRLSSDPRVDVFAYSPNTNEFSQVDDEGEADLWNTWGRKGSDNPEDENPTMNNNLLFAVPSNRSKHF